MNSPNKLLQNVSLFLGIIVALIVIWQFILSRLPTSNPVPPPAITITSSAPVDSPTQASPQQIDVPSGVSQNVFVGDCVDTFDCTNIHARYIVVFDHGPSKRAKITGDGTVVGTATVYRNSGCSAS
jgi:hypothetical protein